MLRWVQWARSPAKGIDGQPPSMQTLSNAMKPTLSICCLVLVAACAAPSARLVVDGDTVEVRTARDEPFAVVRTAAEPRPYVWPVFGPGGVEMTRNHPMGERDGEQHDHPHHQSLWFAHGSVAGFDFWHGSGKGERMVRTACETNDANASVRCRYDWIVDGAGGAPLVVLREVRELRFADRGSWREVEVRVALSPGGEAVTFGDTKEGTFAVRVHPALRAEGPIATGRLSNSEGHTGKDAWGKRARWIDDTGTVDGQEVGVAMFDHPNNPRAPTWWHARSYGLLAANPFGAHDFAGEPAGAGDMTIEPGDTLELRYLVVLHGAGFDRAKIESVYQGWIGR